MIHETAIIHPDAKVHQSARVGPYAVIDGEVSVGPDCEVGPHVHLTGRTTIGAGNRFHAGCVIGDAPQDLKYNDQLTQLVVGDQNCFREHVTIHRSNCLEEETVIGSDNFFMAASHVGHNSVVGDRVILANGALVGGHAQVGDGAFLSGNAVVHQFVRVGELAMMQGCAGASQDLPPFTMLRGINSMCGLNAVGLRRAGFSVEERTELKQAYRLLFRSNGLLRDALGKAQEQFTLEPTRRLMEFVASSERGICGDK